MHGRSEFLMESWLSRIMHCILEVVNLFVLAVFGAVITSQLTTASILAVPPTVNVLRGLRIGIQTNLLQPILQSVQVAAIPVIYNTLEDAVKLIYTTNPDNLDGYMTTTEIVQYFNQKYGNGQFVQTATFLSSDNTPDQKAFAISKALPRATESLFNQALMDLGATVCTARAPQCPTCTVSGSCAARAAACCAMRSARCFSKAS